MRGLPVQILLEPYSAHVLSDAAACVRMARKFPGGEVKAVLDAPNLIPAESLRRPQRPLCRPWSPSWPPPSAWCI